MSINFREKDIRKEWLLKKASVLGFSLFILVFSLIFDTGLAAPSESDRSIAIAQHKIKRNPENPNPYYQLADAYILKGRESGDISYFNLAEQALLKSLSLDPKQSDVLRHLAYVLSLHHNFNKSAIEAVRAIELDPENYDAYGVLGDAYIETGRYDKAAKAYQDMIRIKKDLSSHSRMSGLKSLIGNPKGAIRDLKLAIQAGKDSNQPGESIAWAQWQLGMEYFNIGNLQKSEMNFLSAIESYPNYYRALGGLAQVRAAQGRYEEAIDLYKKALAIIPLPEYAAALGDLYTKLGRDAEAKKQYEMVEYIGLLNSLNKIIYNRELGYFYADHDLKIKYALELARKELEIRKDIYGYDLLAWTLYKDGKAEEAVPAIKEALRLGTKDARLFYHAGMIYEKINDRMNAEKYLKLAIKTNPYFHLLHAEIAKQTLEQLQGKGTIQLGALEKD